MNKENKKTIQLIAIDVGYGDVKVKYEDKIFKFPTCIEKQPQSRRGFSAEDSGLSVYNYKGKKYIVDHNKNNAINTRNIDFLINFGPLLVFHAMKLAGIDFNKPIHLVSGLSFVNWERVNEFYDALETIIVDDIKINLKGHLSMRPQGRGVFDDFTDDKTGLIYVVDIGFNTLDILSYENSKPIPHASEAKKTGAFKIISDMRNMLINDFGGGVDISEQKAKEVFVNEFIEVAGEIIDLKERVKELKEEYCDFLINELSSNDDISFAAKKVIFGGGGAYFIDKEYMRSILPNAVFSDEPFEYSNVRGYYKSEESIFNNINIKE